MDRGAWQTNLRGVGHDWATKHSTFLHKNMFEFSYPDTVLFNIYLFI